MEPHFAIFRWLGLFDVKFRYLIVLVWVAVTVAAVATLPSLSSVTNENNSSFLPANSPSLHAARRGSVPGWNSAHFADSRQPVDRTIDGR